MLPMSVVTERLVSKAEAAEYLGVSAGAVERYTARGRLTARRGHAGDGYDVGELRNLKSEMDARTRCAESAAAALVSKARLRLDEASAVSGVARQVIIAAILGGNLAAELTGDGYEVGREELEAFAQKRSAVPVRFLFFRGR